MPIHTIQYPDGRTEQFLTPVSWTPGDIVAVTHRRDGGGLLQRVSPVRSEPKSGSATWGTGGALGINADNLYLRWYVKRIGDYGVDQTVRVTLDFYRAGIPDMVWEFDPDLYGESWTEAAIGPWNRLGIKYIVITGSYTQGGCPVYFDNFRIRGGGSWDFGNGSFVCEGDAELTTEEYYSGTNSIKIL